ncbi:Alpha-galactosidase 3 [Linum perenne]
MGQMVPDPKTFKSGIKTLADYVHSKGLKLGIYSDAGAFTCQVRPGSIFHEKEDATSFASWDVDYLKYDNCFNLGIDPKKRGVDDPALWAGKVGNSWRTTDDINDTWISMTTIADLNDKWAAYAGPGGWNDPDMLEVGNGGMNYHEYRSHFSIWALIKSPLLIGCDVRNMTAETKEILSNAEVIAVNQDPLGVQGRKVHTNGTDGCQQVLFPSSLPIRNIYCVYRDSSTFHTEIVSVAANITAQWDVIGLEASTSVSVRDLWQQKVVTNNAVASFGAQVDAHGCEMYIFTPQTAAGSKVM